MIILRIFFRPMMGIGVVGLILLFFVIFVVIPGVYETYRPDLPGAVELECRYEPPIEYEGVVYASDNTRPCNAIPELGDPIAMDDREDSSSIHLEVGGSDRTVETLGLRSNTYRAYCEHWDWHDEWLIVIGDNERVEESELNDRKCTKYGYAYSDIVRLSMTCRDETHYTVHWRLFDGSGDEKLHASYAIECVWEDGKS